MFDDRKGGQGQTSYFPAMPRCADIPDPLVKGDQEFWNMHTGKLAEKGARGKGAIRGMHLRLDPLGSCLDSELEGAVVTVAFDGEFHTAALARSRRPGGLPEMVGVPIGCDDRNFRHPDNSRAIAWGALTDAGAVGYALQQGIPPLPGSV